ncbi:hypothetical protein [Pelagicoccus sp. SDUM812003]|uniref:hypothetical protein n=1 Tax=Pelagicoccus sp. SDUM812003 TaxID=3041267 RepID=UPI00280EFA92|nr:hypothetical protein [Pelagicoccus sp. SDUM812003]MDQ8203835.1 hypothetical protein [Pelagicoccus sp. SDUM812003]
MTRKDDSDTKLSDAAARENEPPPPPFNKELDPDNVTSPLDYEKRVEEGREHFYPEGGPEDPPSRTYDEEYGRSESG